jgi:putative addiction module killer protein/probable addiction module antidote protein
MPAIRSTVAFERWLKRLRDQRARAKILARIDRLQMGNPGDVQSIGEGVTEMRIDFGPGYRVYYTQLGSGYVMLLAGDKSSQERDIRKAKAMARDLDKARRRSEFDTARHLDNPEVIAHYLAEAFQTHDNGLIVRAIGNVVRAGRIKTISEIARETGLSRTSLYWKEKTSPEFTTVLEVLGAVGVRLEPTPARPPRSPGRKRRQPPPPSRTSAHAGSRGRH